MMQFIKPNTTSIDNNNIHDIYDIQKQKDQTSIQAGHQAY